MKVTSLILLAGNSQRFKSDTPKQFFCINNKPLIYYTISSFENCSLIDEIILVAKKDDFNFIKEIIKKYEFKKVINIVEGGKERTDSVKNGLNIIKNTDIVLIHDGARPIVNEITIKNILNALKDFDAAVPVLKCEDSMSNIDGEYIDRNELVRIQTPQGFKFKVILDAYKNITGTFTDDASILKDKSKVKFVEGSKDSQKVTTIDDVYLIESIIRGRKL